jgi:hypothetical protein
MLDFMLALAILFSMTVLAPTVLFTRIIILLDVGEDIRMACGLDIIGEGHSFLKEIIIRW